MLVVSEGLGEDTYVDGSSQYTLIHACGGIMVVGGKLCDDKAGEMGVGWGGGVWMREDCERWQAASFSSSWSPSLESPTTGTLLVSEMCVTDWSDLFSTVNALAC